MDESLPLLIVYSRRGCHLREEMLGRAQVRVNDVDTNSEWVELYGLLVPVLYYSGSEVCRYRLDRKALLTLLSDSKI